MKTPIHRSAAPFAALLALALAVAACSAGDVPPASSPPTGAGGGQMSQPPVSASDDGPTTSHSATESMGAAPSASEAALDDPLLTTELRDVTTGSTFTLAELAAEEPVIVETMAIWCTNCRSQMQQVTAAHELAEFHSVSIDVEPTEIAEDLAAYADREGFDWPFVLADAELATLLRDRFGTEVLFPPGMPKVLVRPDGSVELLPLGQLLTAEQIAALVEG